ncbi:hypothetical protein ABW21_db0204636 [Orbilia brochopaga]|nr:hypothetical protein ABW21_db0204636 [Drechslerella brochopaga]
MIVLPAYSGWQAPVVPLPDSAKHTKHIVVRHPSYDEEVNVIIRLPALDLPDHLHLHLSDTPEGNITEKLELYREHAGIHRGTLLLILFIITSRTGNLYPERLEAPEKGRARKRHKAGANEPRAPEPSDDDLFTGESYYYYPDSYQENEAYQVTESFRKWKFPHNSLLPFSQKWDNIMSGNLNATVPRSSDMSTWIINRDASCKVTGCPDGTEAAHLVPREEVEWWRRNHMRVFTHAGKRVKDPTTVPENLITLRADIHRVFNKSSFLFAVKEKKLVCHFINLEDSYTLQNLHNRPVRAPQTLSADYVISRMAWAVFKEVDEDFLQFQRDRGGGKPSKDIGLDEDKNSRVSGRSEGARQDPGEGPSKRSDKPSGKKRGAGGAEGQGDRKRKNFETDDYETQLEERSEKFLESLLPEGTFDGKVPIGDLTTKQQHILAHTAIYPGANRVNKMKEAYKSAHPEISAVADAENVWEETEDDGDE